MTLRITEPMRQAITVRLLQHRFEKYEKALRRRENELALKFYRAIYSAADRQRWQSMPSGWLPTTDKIRLAWGDRRVELRLSDSIPLPFTDQYTRHHVANIKGGEALRERLNDFVKFESEYQSEREAVREKTARTLAGFGTVGSLLRAWPEVKPFLDQLGYDSEKKSLPAIIPADLNASLGLQPAA